MPATGGGIGAPVLLPIRLESSFENRHLECGIEAAAIG